MGFIITGALAAFKNNTSVILPMGNLIDSVPQMYLTMKSFSHEGIFWEREII